MFRRSTNNPWIPPGGINSSYFGTIGGADIGSLDNRYPGLLGQTVVHSNSSALKSSKTTVGTLFEGVYQLVKFNTAVVRGQLLFWDTLANNGINDFEVVNTTSAAACFRAGVCLFTDAAATGKFGYIQVAGLASMQFANAAVGTIGLGVIQATAVNVGLLTVNTVNTIADATAITAAEKRAWVGTAYETPTQNVISRVLMSSDGFLVNIG
jgi:hypothetical protein